MIVSMIIVCDSLCGLLTHGFTWRIVFGCGVVWCGVVCCAMYCALCFPCAGVALCCTTDGAGLHLAGCVFNQRAPPPALQQSTRQRSSRASSSQSHSRAPTTSSPLVSAHASTTSQAAYQRAPAHHGDDDDAPASSPSPSLPPSSSPSSMTYHAHHRGSPTAAMQNRGASTVSHRSLAPRVSFLTAFCIALRRPSVRWLLVGSSVRFFGGFTIAAFAPLFFEVRCVTTAAVCVCSCG